MTPEGRFIAFGSTGTNLDPADVGAAEDIFLRDTRATGFDQLCEPGQAGVIACPCSNPPASTGRGCDNSWATGGATLTATGSAHLSFDTLVLSVTGEPPTTTSIVLQGDLLLPSGQVFGQGIRCIGGRLERLYVKSASGGVVFAPDFAAHERGISARSATLGDAIQPGDVRFYVVYYRDGSVLGGCPAQSIFNATISGSVGWQP